MNLQRISANGVVYYTSPQLTRCRVPHAFSTRIGGRSPAPFDSFNLGNPSREVRDDSARIVGHYRDLEELIGASGRERCWLHQVHGANVVTVRAGRTHDNSTKADALICEDPQRIVSVRVADCCPVLLATQNGRHVAAIHAGWRGTAAGVVTLTLKVLLAQSEQDATEIVAAIGPCIGREAFEVGPEVLAEFRRAFGAETPLIEERGDGKGRADIRAALRRQLLNAGVADAHIDSSDLCTVQNPKEFYSHRRDHGVTGRMAALIGPSRR